MALDLWLIGKALFSFSIVSILSDSLRLHNVYSIHVGHLRRHFRLHFRRVHLYFRRFALMSFMSVISSSRSKI